MKPTKTKADLRREIDDQIQHYLDQGGAVQRYQAGESGRELNSPLPKSPHIERTQQVRTPVLSEIRAIESRRHPPKGSLLRRRASRGQKVLLTDDFGEPLRWVSKD